MAVADTTAMPLAAPQGDASFQHSFALHDNSGAVRVWQAPAPNYRAADQCDCAALIATPQLRPLALSDMIPFVAYRPGSILLSRYYPEIRVMTRIVGWVEPSLRHDARAALLALLKQQTAIGRPALRQFLTHIVQAKIQSPTGWRISEAEIEQSRIATLIL